MTRALVFAAVLATIALWISWNARSFLIALGLIVAWTVAGLVIALMCHESRYPESRDIDEWSDYLRALDEVGR